MRWRTPNSTAMLGVVLRLSSPVLPFDAPVSTARRPMPATSHKDYGEPWWNMNHTVSWYIHRSHRKHGFRPSRSYITRLASRFERQNSHIWTAISSNPPISLASEIAALYDGISTVPGVSNALRREMKVREPEISSSDLLAGRVHN